MGLQKRESITNDNESAKRAQERESIETIVNLTMGPQERESITNEGGRMKEKLA